MATLFLDFEGGNDNYAGTSFATLADGTDGRITTATFSSAGANFPNDGSLIGQYLSIFNGTIYAVYNITAYVSSTSLTIAAISGGTALANQAVDRQYYIGGRWKNITTGATAVRIIPGDTIRIMGSPAPTSLGINGTWTSGVLQATKSITGATNATPISVTCTAHGYSTGDTVVITGDTGNTAANGTWEITVTGVNTFTLDGSSGNGTSAGTRTVRLRNNTRITLGSAVTQNIASTGPGRTAWTQSANVTATLSTTTKQHRDSDSIAIAAGFTTGLAAYKATGTLDLSGYQQVSFWIQQTTGTVGAAGAVDLRLCSDNAGVTAVNTISIPNLIVVGRWMPVTVDLGTNLGNSIQSIALYVNTDNGAQTFLLSNIIACKASSAADSLTLTSLIGKNTTGEAWWGIQSINDTRIMLDADANAVPTDTQVRGYYGTTETVTTWKRETIKQGPALADSTVVQSVTDSGTAADNVITFSCGWDRTDMSTQNLETWIDGQNGNGYGIQIPTSRTYVTLEKVAAVRYTRGIDVGNATFITVDAVQVGNCTGTSNTPGISLSTGSNNTLRIDNIVASRTMGLGLGGFSHSVYLGNGIFSSGSSNIYANGVRNFLIRPKSNSSTVFATSANCNTSSLGVINGASYTVERLIFKDNSAASIDPVDLDSYLIKCSLDDATEVTAYGNNNSSIFSQNHDNTADNHKIFGQGFLISSATDQRHTASGISWKIQPTSAVRNVNRPVSLSLAKIACAANSLVTVKAWMRRSNTALTMNLVCKGGQLAGVTDDISTSITAAADTWEELTITFTPTEIGVIEIRAEAYGGTTHSGWVDDLTITQA